MCFTIFHSLDVTTENVDRHQKLKDKIKDQAIAQFFDNSTEIVLDFHSFHNSISSVYWQTTLFNQLPLEKLTKMFFG